MQCMLSELTVGYSFVQMPHLKPKDFNFPMFFVVDLGLFLPFNLYLCLARGSLVVRWSNIVGTHGGYIDSIISSSRLCINGVTMDSLCV